MASLRPTLRLRHIHSLPQALTFTPRTFSTTHSLRQQHPQYPQTPERPVSIYKTHGRALFKALTLAFFSYQVVYWAWLTLETEEIKDQKNQEIKSLEREVRLLEEGRRGHKPGA